jgi:hypothetical protein
VNNGVKKTGEEVTERTDYAALFLKDFIDKLGLTSIAARALTDRLPFCDIRERRDEMLKLHDDMGTVLTALADARGVIRDHAEGLTAYLAKIPPPKPTRR